MVADECLSPSDFLAFLTNRLKLLCEIKGRRLLLLFVLYIS